MLTPDDLYKLAKSRFKEAKTLTADNKPDGAVYLCGYALELMLKRKICLILDWDGFPENNPEFKKENVNSFKSHDLETLLHLSGVKKQLYNNTSIEASWRIAKQWKSENRYRRIGEIKQADAEATIEATRKVINWILSN